MVSGAIDAMVLGLHGMGEGSRHGDGVSMWKVHGLREFVD